MERPTEYVYSDTRQYVYVCAVLPLRQSDWMFKRRMLCSFTLSARRIAEDNCLLRLNGGSKHVGVATCARILCAARHVYKNCNKHTSSGSYGHAWQQILFKCYIH